MADQFAALLPRHRAFIERQHLFFTASADADGHVNLSPKGLDALRILSDNSVCYLDRTGSGNETSAHLMADERLTIMMCAFEGPPLILRLYGHGRVHLKDTEDYRSLIQRAFGGSEPHGARQIIVLDFDLVQTSCGYGVPHYEYQAERPSLPRWAEAKSEAEIRQYWRDANMVSIDGKPTAFASDAAE